ncbi:DUF1285 domain-containing protein [Moraxella nasovis]|uniref:DUF1285 domain-containing protein n=1 Tax=Moraxella nasovis TaxID=2904121 RepID=UPI001F616D8E|nr:DUF1285 domain-containing protein [Moraxella nasovis]UNU73937.1 DUF1285 domain-containing protein [Moraxella nasovis]
MNANHHKHPTQQNALDHLIQAIPSERPIPPLELWSPKIITPFDIRIADNGDWYHEGVKITRQSLVDLFASVLWAQIEGDKKRHFLKTPSHQYEICVADVPLFINQVEEVAIDGMTLIKFTTTHGDEIFLDEQHIPYFKTVMNDGVLDERLHIDTRFNLTARVNRNVLYHLVEMGQLTDKGTGTVLSLTSGNQTFEIKQDKR